MSFIERHALFGRGVGYVDVHLLAAVRMTTGVSPWTNDRKLHAVADALGLAMQPDRDPEARDRALGRPLRRPPATPPLRGRRRRPTPDCP